MGMTDAAHIAPAAVTLQMKGRLGGGEVSPAGLHHPSLAVHDHGHIRGEKAFADAGGGHQKKPLPQTAAKVSIVGGHPAPLPHPTSQLAYEPALGLIIHIALSFMRIDCIYHYNAPRRGWQVRRKKKGSPRCGEP